MRKIFLSLAMALSMAVIAVPAFATNGSDMFGVGTISRSMGGVGTAAPQDAITAVFGNPAAMCYIPCETSEVDFAGTIFDPTVKATVNGFEKTSQGAPYVIPAIGIYTPLNDKWKLGLSAYGSSGLGVDYRNVTMFNNVKTDLQIMKIAPNLAYKISDKVSVGAAFQINWAALDLGQGLSHNFGFGAQLGAIYRPMDGLTLGVTYQTPQKHDFDRVTNFGNPASPLVTLSLEQPQRVAIGVAYDFIPNKLLVEVDGKWINWANATGYKDFDWKDQYSVGVGAQYKVTDMVTLRAGYNYANNPVNQHNGWNPGPAAVTMVEGNAVNTFGYEFLRTVGFPAIVEQHVCVGAGLNLTKKISLNAGYTHAFKKSFTETSLGGVNLKSELSENSVEFGLNLMF